LENFIYHGLKAWLADQAHGVNLHLLDLPENRCNEAIAIELYHFLELFPNTEQANSLQQEIFRKYTSVLDSLWNSAEVQRDLFPLHNHISLRKHLSHMLVYSAVNETLKKLQRLHSFICVC
jgi:hypothetical protein